MVYSITKSLCLPCPFIHVKLPHHGKTWRRLTCTILSPRSQTKEATYDRIPITWFSGGEKTHSRDHQCSIMRRTSRESLGQWKYSPWYYNDGPKSLCLSEPAERTPPSVNCDVNCRPWVTRMGQCRRISCNKCTTPAGDAGGRRLCACGGRGVMGKFLLSQFFCEPKTAKKN